MSFQPRHKGSEDEKTSLKEILFLVGLFIFVTTFFMYHVISVEAFFNSIFNSIIRGG